MAKRVFLIVLDSFGVGAEPDAPLFGDVGTNTLGAIAGHPNFRGDNLARLGMFNLDGVTCGTPAAAPIGSYARLREASAGKDTTIGHWEIAGLLSAEPLPTFPDGFPQELLDAFTAKTGYKVLCNKPYSGTDVIRDYGEEHMKTGALIVYTSADSVFQIAANEAIVPVEKLYEICAQARELLTGKYGVGRVIARPFVGDCAANFTRTPRRHDYSLVPPHDTMLDAILAAGKQTIGVGKIHDIFAGKGIGETIRTSGNTEGLQVTLDLADANNWLESQGAKPEPDLASLAKNAIVHAEVERAVNAANEGVSRAESIRKFEILPDEFTEANGMLTPSLKTRRAQIVEHYRELIDDVIYVPLKK